MANRHGQLPVFCRESPSWTWIVTRAFQMVIPTLDVINLRGLNVSRIDSRKLKTKFLGNFWHCFMMSSILYNLSAWYLTTLPQLNNFSQWYHQVFTRILGLLFLGSSRHPRHPLVFANFPPLPHSHHTAYTVCL